MRPVLTESALERGVKTLSAYGNFVIIERSFHGLHSGYSIGIPATKILYMLNKFGYTRSYNNTVVFLDYTASSRYRPAAPKLKGQQNAPAELARRKSVFRLSAEQKNRLLPEQIPEPPRRVEP